VLNATGCGKRGVACDSYSVVTVVLFYTAACINAVHSDESTILYNCRAYLFRCSISIRAVMFTVLISLFGFQRVNSATFWGNVWAAPSYYLLYAYFGNIHFLTAGQRICGLLEGILRVTNSLDNNNNNNDNNNNTVYTFQVL